MPSIGAGLLAALGLSLLWACSSPPAARPCGDALPHARAAPVADAPPEPLPDPGDGPPLKFAQ